MTILDGKAVIITGSGRGIGAACAQGAAARGAAVIVNDVDPDLADETVAAIRAAGGRAEPCVADVRDWDAAGRLVQACVDAFGRIDGLVNNAGLAQVSRIEAIDPAATQRLIDVNVIGPLYCTAHAVGPMLRQGAGSIVNVTSGAHMGLAQLSVYAASKGAVASMVYSLALELAGTGVRINGLSPIAAGTGMSPDDPVNQSAAANSPVVEYLLSDLSAGVTGQIIRIDREQLHIYAHPALLLPPVVRQQWSAETIAEAFAAELLDRLVPCGVQGMLGAPTELADGYWKRKDQQ
jgi:NAD(P)-dependent dehydrogenase (short-subunit alcohol dehydrogenase family)